MENTFKEVKISDLEVLDVDSVEVREPMYAVDDPRCIYDVYPSWAETLRHWNLENGDLAEYNASTKVVRLWVVD